MAELKTKASELKTAEVATYVAITEHDGPKLVKTQDPGATDKTAVAAGPIPLVL